MTYAPTANNYRVGREWERRGAGDIGERMQQVGRGTIVLF